MNVMNKIKSVLLLIKKAFLSKPTDLELLKKYGCEIRGGVKSNGYTKIQKWHPKGKIIFENNVVLNNLPDSNLAGILHECRFVTMREDSIITLGEGCGLSGVTIMCAKKVTIGPHVALGANVTIYDNDMHSINPYLRKFDNDSHVNAKEVTIEEYAWIGAHSIILKGVHIGKGAVIGAGSVVTSDVPSLTVYAGNPAMFIKEIELTENQHKWFVGNK